MSLPPIKEQIGELERMAKPSVDVLVKVEGVRGVQTGRYYHGSEFWTIDGLHGQSWVVTEWWPMPEPGTGNKV